MEQEEWLEVYDEDFQKVLNRLENKGSEQEASQRILKLDEVRKLRMKTGIKLKEKLFLGHDGDFVLDSSHLIGAQRILRFMQEWKKRKAKLLNEGAGTASGENLHLKSQNTDKKTTKKGDEDDGEEKGDGNKAKTAEAPEDETKREPNDEDLVLDNW